MTPPIAIGPFAVSEQYKHIRKPIVDSPSYFASSSVSELYASTMQQPDKNDTFGGLELITSNVSKSLMDKHTATQSNKPYNSSLRLLKPKYANGGGGGGGIPSNSYDLAA